MYVCICPNSKTHLSKLASAAEIVRHGNNGAAANCKWQLHDTMQFEKRSKEIVQWSLPFDPHSNISDGSRLASAGGKTAIMVQGQQLPVQLIARGGCTMVLGS